MARVRALRHNNPIRPKRISEAELKAIGEAVGRFPSGAALDEISGFLTSSRPRRTLQRRLWVTTALFLTTIDRTDPSTSPAYKAAIELLVDQSAEIGLNPYTIRNLHALLSDFDCNTVKEGLVLMWGPPR